MSAWDWIEADCLPKWTDCAYITNNDHLPGGIDATITDQYCAPSYGNNNCLHNDLINKDADSDESLVDNHYK